jgi:hypothetical protein
VGLKYIEIEKYKVGRIDVIFPEDGTLKESGHDFVTNGISFLEF